MRKSMVFSGLMALGMAVAPAGASAEEIKGQAIFKSGQQLLDQCTSYSADNVADCDWYIMGVWDAFGLLADLKVTERYMCLASGTTVDVLRNTVVSHLRSISSTDLSQSAISNVANALVEAHPCS
jgi:hypothetical protein